MNQHSVHFYKLQGCGNDYVYFNLFDPATAAFWAELDNNARTRMIQKTADRRFGVGGDGVILVQPAPGFDGQMVMFNADGSMGAMCGNGLRCVAKLLYDLKLAQKDTLRILTGAGERVVAVVAANGRLAQATVDMGAADFSPGAVGLEPTSRFHHGGKPPTIANGLQNTPGMPMPSVSDTSDAITLAMQGKPVVDAAFLAGGKNWKITCLSMGNPHCVIFAEDPYTLDLEKIGPGFEKHPFFGQSVNTEFVQILTPTRLKMRVWERGSGETYACGTGASGVAAAAVRLGISPKNTPITVHLRGGDLVITVTDQTVFMTGPAVLVYQGDLQI